MNQSGNYRVSNGGSVKLFDGQFYMGSSWVLVFTPLTRQEELDFMFQVESSERKAQRRLTRAELLHLADVVS